MKVLFNCVVNSAGGAVQNAANFINIALDDTDIDYLFIVSREVYELLARWERATDVRVMLFDHPLRSSHVRAEILALESNFQPDIVYTMAGPTYVKFKSLSILGISDPYITHSPFSVFFFGRSVPNAFFFIVKSLAKGILSRLQSDFFVFQTDTSRTRYCRRYLLKRDYTEVIPNAVGESFKGLGSVSFDFQDPSRNTLFILCPAADYPHKDLLIIKRMAEWLRANPGVQAPGVLAFTVTVRTDGSMSEELEKINSISDRIQVRNRGPFSYSESRKLYLSHDVVFMPSILETFSTAYLEALASGKFLVVADRNFSREICGDAAVYYAPRVESKAFYALHNILRNSVRPDRCAAKRVLGRYKDYEWRYSNIKKMFFDVLGLK